MKLIIDISDKVYGLLKYFKDAMGLADEKEDKNDDVKTALIRAVINGTPLDDLRADLHATAEMHSDGDYYLRDEWIDEYFDDLGSTESEFSQGLVKDLVKAEREDKE